VQKVPKETLYKYSKDSHHQNIVLKCTSLQYVQISSPDNLYYVAGERNTGLNFVYLDRVNDPHNLGAILRTCVYFGVDGVIVDKFSRCPLTPTVSRTSAGALELKDVYCTENPTEFIKQLKQDHWTVLAAKAPSGTSEEEQSSAKKKRFNPNGNYLICLGSEGFGLDKKLEALADDTLSIHRPAHLQQFPHSLLDSLNVSVACALLLESHLSKFRKDK